jgi:hypothetical protein
MKKLINFLALFLVGFVMQSNAQDALIFRNKAETLYVKVVEVGTTEIKYKLWPVDESMPVMSEKKDKIKRIIFANGTVMKFSESDFADPTNYADQKKMAIKLDMFSMLLGSTSLAFEQSLEPGRSWEVGVGIIGLGADPDNFGNKKGVFVRAGYKFINTPDYYMSGMRYTHILKGGYIRPEIAAHLYSETSSTIESTWDPITFNSIYTKVDSEKSYNGAAFILNFGKQWVFNDIFVVDAFVGGGMGYGSTKTVSEVKTVLTNYPSYYDYYETSGTNQGTGPMIFHDNELFFALQAGLKVGVLIGASKKAEQK